MFLSTKCERWGQDVGNVLRMDGSRIRRRALELMFKGDVLWGGPGTARYSQVLQCTKWRRKYGKEDEIGDCSLVVP
jgi:hypothetical protein